MNRRSRWLTSLRLRTRAGRGKQWSITAQCFSYGQAIGMAAAMSLRNGVVPRKLPISNLRDALRRDGVVIKPSQQATAGSSP